MACLGPDPTRGGVVAFRRHSLIRSRDLVGHSDQIVIKVAILRHFPWWGGDGGQGIVVK